MKKRWIPFIMVLVLALGALACQAATSGGNIPAQSPTKVQPSPVLFQDDFSDPSSGWNQAQEADGMTDYASGGYRIFVNTDNADFWATPGLDFTDVRIDVDVTKVAGPDDNDLGIICRYNADTTDHYFFLISSDGYYGIGIYYNGEQKLLGSENMEFSDVIVQGDNLNHLRADCVGSQLTLYANGTQLLSVQDTTLSSGDAGLIAGTFDTPGTDTLFDNFSVQKP